MATASVRIRPAHHTDWGAMAAMLDTFTAQHHGWGPDKFRPVPIGFTPAVFQTWLERPDELHLAAEVEDGVVGYAGAGRFEGFASELMFPRRSVHVFLLMVAARAQRKGVGRALLRAVEDWAAEYEAEVIGLNMSGSNETARAFYAALGYDLVSEYRTRPLRRVKRFESDP